MFGGQSHPDFDNDMSIFVEPTRQEEIKELRELGIAEDKIPEIAEKKVIKRIHQAMQGICYNLNSMHSRAGSQVPFSSVNIGIPRSKDAALICQIFLEEYEKGFGKGEQFIFPNIIFKVKEGVNREENDPYFYLFKLACRVAAKRMNPTFMNIDADFNKEYYNKGYVGATMGCVQGKETIIYKYEDEVYTDNFEKFWNCISNDFKVNEQNNKQGWYIQPNNLSVYDSKNGFVKVKTLIKNKDQSNWIKLTLQNGQEFIATEDHPLPVVNKGRTYLKDISVTDEIYITDSFTLFKYLEECGLGFLTDNMRFKLEPIKIKSIEYLGYLNEYSYDVETESDHFDVSGIYSHNCRTYLMSNVNGEPGCKGRGNIAPTTINLPRLGILANKDINKFFELLDNRLDLVKRALLYRYSVLKNLKVKDLPFVAGQGLLRGSEGLKSDDSIEPILKQGTYAIGFIGLAETLIALTGKHHGEDENARELGYNIIQHIRDYTDKTTKETHLNWSCYSTPRNMWVA